MNIVSLAEGNSLWIQAKKSDTRETEDRLFRLVMSKFEASIRSTPDNRDTLNNYADVLCQKANNSIGKLQHTPHTPHTLAHTRTHSHTPHALH